MNQNLRIRTNVNQDKEVRVQLNQDFDLGMLQTSVNTDLNNVFNDVIYISIKENGSLFEHTEKFPLKPENCNVLRCQILVSKSVSGGEFYIDDDLVQIDVGDVYFYFADESKIKVNECTEGTRNNLLLGWILPNEITSVTEKINNY